MTEDLHPRREDEPAQDWPDLDIEEAYRRALEANDAAEWEIGHLASQPSNSHEHRSDTPPADAAHDVESLVEVHDTDETSTPETSEITPVTSPAVLDLPARISPRQVIEAALFVGCQPLTAKKLCYLLRGDFDLDFIEQTIEQLNHQYLAEERPYEIRLGEGGYRFVLHEEFQRLRNRVYGIGPREVKLSQDVLEVLALVAYRQPVTQADIEGLGKSNPGPSLRQLLRRELISLERDPQDRKNVKYRTTRRFLSVFGLGKLDELPQADELMFK